MNRVEGKVALITGAARGQGRSHALRLAEEGADVIGIDLCEPIGSAPYEGATAEDLEETRRQVEALGRRAQVAQADVRDLAGLKSAVDAAVGDLGPIGIISANAGIFSTGMALDLEDGQWSEMIDINLTGVWHTVKAGAPSMIEAGNGGSIVLTSSTAGLRGFGMCSHYTAAKHGVVGLMRSLANELAQHRIRVNSVHPASCDTDMIQNDATYGMFRPDLEAPTAEDALPAFKSLHLLPDLPWIEPIDVSNAVLWLSSDEARYVTGVALPVDAGFLEKNG